MNQPLTLMVVHAHPDDEVIGTGGVLCRYGDEGVRTVLVTATLGEEGEIVDAELNTPEVRADLGAVRRAELERAVAILGVSRLELLGYRDSGMAGAESNRHPACFNSADMDDATQRLVRLVRSHRPHVLVTYDAQGGYGHPDHIACHRATAAAWEAAGDPARYPEAGAPWAPLKLYATASPRERWLRIFELLRERGLQTPFDNPEFDITRFTVPEASITTALAVGAYQGRKREALLVHRTQIAADGPFFSLPEDAAGELFDKEFFTLVAARVPLPEREGLEEDLFAGIR
jgi:N-acetyl-1-D-myo-inositol-2-amino-2-deoxy-alpha-D-glucopyranoside deacetylase